MLGTNGEAVIEKLNKIIDEKKTEKEGTKKAGVA